jgi:hypothetical protein
MINNQHLPEWFSCTINIKDKAIVKLWLNEQSKNPIQMICTATEAFIFFNDEGLAALFKLAHGEKILPEQI